LGSSREPAREPAVTTSASLEERFVA
jgi:hypothetical protein